ncbi:UPF0187-domain-containing protein [Microstroma glucosiphilum]|uniref:UPF0187-domain-containing protein n=1 Tax=Pseudomicrostroma glucosiphilum TaxID=1684307 RepID=A0A316U449_9BASI|nr:UPF0187-domain-containing protein [Pseudomicrostroma glucosiphilum]PWN20007.1 UPF0187-domain-containing protein [Pseudomicrostroma glucosiphilum]
MAERPSSSTLSRSEAGGQSRQARGSRTAHPGSASASPSRRADVASRNLLVQSAREAQKPRLSRMSFFRDALRLGSSCLPRILPSVLGIILWSALIYISDHFFGRQWFSSASVAAPFSVVVGLLLVFRNSTSYDRWYEARKVWASATADAGWLARYLWANVQVDVIGPEPTAGASAGSRAASQGSGGEGGGGGGGEGRSHSVMSPHAPDNMSHHRIRTPSMLFDTIYDVSSSSEGPARPISTVSTSSTGASHYGSTAPAGQTRGQAEGATGPSAPPPTREPNSPRTASVQDIARRTEKKRRAIRLLVLFMQSVAHELRREEGIDWADYQGLLPEDMRAFWTALPEEDDKSDDEEPAQRAGDQEIGSQGTRSPSEAVGRGGSGSGDEDVAVPATWPFFSWFTAWRSQKVDGVQEDANDETSPLLPTHAQVSGSSRATVLATTFPASPISPATRAGLTLSTHTLYELGRYIASARKAGMLNDAGPAGTSLANGILHSLSLSRSSLDRIAHTAIPLVYGIHLKQCTLLYLLALPLTLVSELGWKSVPFTGLVAITLLGLEGISSEVEMPFGDDQSDHNLALWCAQFRVEIEGILEGLEEGADVGLCL